MRTKLFNFLVQQSSCNGRWKALVLHPHDAAQALTLEHQVEGRVDLRERHAVGDELLHLQLLHTGDSQHKFDPSENMLHTTMNEHFRISLFSFLFVS